MKLNIEPLAFQREINTWLKIKISSYVNCLSTTGIYIQYRINFGNLLMKAKIRKAEIGMTSTVNFKNNNHEYPVWHLIRKTVR